MNRNVSVRLFVALVLGASSLSAATLTWDPSATAGGSDGSGTWNSANANWWDGSNVTNWSVGDTAIFGAGGTAGTVTLGETITIGNLTFGTSVVGAYTLSGGTLSLAGPSTFTANSNGVISSTLADGSLVKAGAARLTLNGANTYAAGTTINAGMAMAGNAAAFGSGSVSIGGSGTLGVNGGYTIANGINITTGVAIDTTAAGSGAAPVFSGTITGSGTWTLNANGDTSNSGGGVGGSARLSGANDFAGAVTIASGVVDIDSGFGNATNAIILNGGGTVDKNLNSTLSNVIQVGPAGGVLRCYGGVTGSTIGGALADLNPASPGVLRHTDGGVLILNAAGTFSGIFSNAAGNLRIGHAQALQNSLLVPSSVAVNSTTPSITFGTPTYYVLGGLAGSGGISLNNGSAVTLAVGNRNDTNTYYGVLSNSGGLVKIGAGMQTLGAVNTFTGSIVVSQGVLNVIAATSGNASGIGNGANTIVVASGATLSFNTNGRTCGYHSGIVTNLGGTITFNTGDNSFASGHVLTFDGAPGVINGSGQLRMRDAGAKYLVTADASGSSVDVSQLILTFAITGGYQFDVADGANANDLTISSPISGHNGGENVTKAGAGVLRLSGVNSYTGPTIVSNGSLRVDGSIAAGAVTVCAGATLGGTGTVGGATSVLAGGTLAPGGTAIGALTINNTLGLAADSTNVIRLSKSGSALTNDQVKGVTGTLTYAGTLRLVLSGDALAPGDKFTIFTLNGGTYAGGFTSYDLPSPGAGMSWDLSGLTVDGSITVVNRSATPIFNPIAGNYAGAQSVTITADTGAKIFYTTDGTDPTTSSPSGVTPVTGVVVPADAHVTIRAFATNAGYANSLVATAAYTTVTTPTWLNAAGGSWGTAGNWLSNVIANASGVTADFSTLTLPTNATVTLDGGRTVGALRFADVGNAYDWMVNTGSGGALTLNGAGCAIAVSNRTATLGAVIAGTGGLTKTGAGTLTLTGDNTFSGALNIDQGTVSIGGAGRLGGGTFAGNVANSDLLFFQSSSGIALSGVVSGTGILAQAGSGPVSLANGANTFSTPAFVYGTGYSDGQDAHVVLGINGDGALGAAGNGLVLMNGGAVFNGWGAGWANHASFTLDAARTIEMAGSIGGVIRVGWTDTVTVNGPIVGTGWLAKSDGGTLSLAVSNSYAGGTALVGGTLSAAADHAIPDGATLLLVGGSLVGSGGVRTISPTNILVQGSVSINSGGATNIAFAGACGLTRSSGTGGFYFSGTHSYSGETAIQTGYAEISGNELYAPNSVFNITSTDPRAIDIWAGKLTVRGLTGTGQIAANGAYNNGATWWWTTSPDKVALSLQVPAAESCTFNGVLKNATWAGSVMTIEKSGAGTQVLGGINTYSGGTFVRGGVLSIATGGVIYANANMAPTMTVTNGGTLELQNWGYDASTNHTQSLGGLAYDNGCLVVDGGKIRIVGTNATDAPRGLNIGAGGAILESAAGANWTLSNNGTQTINNSGVLSLTGAGTGQIDMAIPGAGLIKAGAGTWTLAGASTYTGATAISNGTLLVDGAIAAAAGVEVVAGATLGGTGLIGGAITVDGTLAPGGGGIGTLTASNAVTFNSGSTFSVELGGTSSGQYDVLDMTPNTMDATINGGTLKVRLVNGYFPQAGDSFAIIKAFNIAPYPSVFPSTDLPDLSASNLAWTVTNTGSELVLSVVSAGGPSLTGYDAYSNQFVLAGGPTADPNGDGWKNLAAYALGFNPTGAAHAGLSGGIVSGKLSLTFDVLDSRSDITYWAETSDTLMTNDAGWTWIWTNKPVHTLAGPNAQVLATSGETNTVRVSDSNAGTNRFLRLRISRP